MIKSFILRFLNSRGFDLVRFSAAMNPSDLEIAEKVRGKTATSINRIVGLIDSVRYVCENKIPGAFVECGVWRGGSAMVAALKLIEMGDQSRDLFLYDTFEGMSEPTDADVMFDGTSAKELLNPNEKKEDLANYWCFATDHTVRANVLSTGYPGEKVHLIKGKVEETIPAQMPSQISILRLDTDWFESTAHELEHLYPLLAPNGVLIIDDYGHWAGARKAVDEYFSKLHPKPFLSRMDYTGRLAIKPSA